MPTIRAIFPVSIQAEIVISRDFYLNREQQLAQALYQRIIEMDEDEAVDFLVERMTVLGEGTPVAEQPDTGP